MKGYIKKQAAEALGLKPSLIQYYTDQGIIEPEISSPKGKGTRRIYSKRNLLEILIVQRLISRGLSIKEVKNVMFGLSHSGNQEVDFQKILPGDTENRDKIVADAEYLQQRLKEFWGIESWDGSNSAFIFYHSWNSGGQSELSIIFTPIEKKVKIDTLVNQNTIFVLLVNVTDLPGRINLR